MVSGKADFEEDYRVNSRSREGYWSESNTDFGQCFSECLTVLCSETENLLHSS